MFRSPPNKLESQSSKRFAMTDSESEMPQSGSYGPPGVKYAVNPSKSSVMVILQEIAEAAQGFRDPKAFKAATLKNLVLAGCINPDYFAYKITAKANNGLIKEYEDVLSVLVKPKVNPIPQTLKEEAQTFDLHFFYTSHPEVKQMSDKMLEICMIKAAEIKKM